MTIVESQGLIDRLDDLDSHSKSRNDSIEHSNTWGDDAFLYFRDIRFRGLCSLCQFNLSHFCFLPCIQKYLPGIKSICILLGLSTFWSSFASEPGI